jgi:hypothetical protein
MKNSNSKEIKLISHRGNVNGKNPNKENSPSYIDAAIKQGYDVEVDVWVEQNLIFLGHDVGCYGVDLDWLMERASNLWLHLKNPEAVIYFMTSKFNYFIHDKDMATLTSKGHVWVYPGFQPIPGSIAVLPEIYGESVDTNIGICSDYIEMYSI